MTLAPADFGPTLNDWIGKSQFGGDAYFNGTIDEFRIYEGVLSAQLVQTNYLAGPNVLPVLPPLLQAQIVNTNLVVSWPASAGGFSLFAAQNLNGGLLWSNVNAAVSTNNGLYQMLLPFSSTGAYFYRLKK